MECVTCQTPKNVGAWRPMSWDATYIDTPRGRFFARMAGEPDQPLVLCLHGLLDDASSYDEIVGWLGGHGFRALAPSWRGHLPSPLEFPSTPHEVVTTLTDDLIAICDALTPAEPMSIVCHGSCSAVVFDVLAHSSERFGNIVVLGGERLDLPWHTRWSLQRSGIAAVKPLWERWVYGQCFPYELFSRVQQTLAVSWPHPLQLLALQRRRHVDRPIRNAISHLLGDHDKRARLRGRNFTGPFRETVVADAGSLLHIDQPKVVARLIVDWLTVPYARGVMSRPNAETNNSLMPFPDPTHCYRSLLVSRVV